jgi:hypothetical protein
MAPFTRYEVKVKPVLQVTVSMNHLLARKKSSSSLQGRRSEAGSIGAISATPSDQKPREAKSICVTPRISPYPYCYPLLRFVPLFSPSGLNCGITGE